MYFYYLRITQQSYNVQTDDDRYINRHTYNVQIDIPIDRVRHVYTVTVCHQYWLVDQMCHTS